MLKELGIGEQYYRLLDFSPVPMGVHSEGKWVYVNRSGLQLVGAKTQEDLLGRPILDVVHPDYRDIVLSRQHELACEGKDVPLIEEKLLTLDGRVVDVEIAAMPVTYLGKSAVQVVLRDVTERKRVEAKLRYRMKFEKLITTISTNFINLMPDEIDQEIFTSLRAIGMFVEADRSSIFLFRENRSRVSLAYEWFGEGVPPRREVMQDLQVGDFPWWFNHILKQQNINIPCVSKMAPEARREQELLQALEIQSLVTVPMVYGKKVFGYLGFSWERTQKTLSREFITLLKMVGEIFQHALERKRTEKVVLQSEARFRAVFQGSDIGLILMNRNGYIIEANPAVSDILGYQPKELARKHFTKLNHPEDTYEITQFYQEMIAGKRDNYQVEKRYLHKNTNTVWVQLKVSALRLPNGEIEFIVVSMEDITERNQAKEALFSSEERFSKAFNTSPSLMTIMSMDTGKYIDINENFLSSTGYKREQVIGRSPEELNLWQDPAVRKKFLGQIFKKKRVRNLEFNYLTSTGEVRMGLVSAEVMDIGGKPCLLTVTNDITDRKQLELEMARLDRLNIVGELAASIGHEVRNPMTTVRGFLQLFKEKPGFDSYHEHLELMIEELDRANSIISEFLSLARNRSIAFASGNLNKIIEALYPLLRADALVSEKNVCLELGEVPDFPLNEKEVRQLILNLVRNGLEAMNTGGTLTISTTWEDKRVVLSVQDEGKGIAPEFIEKLGTPFLTSKDQGTGLGLAVCYSIAHRHKAVIDVDTGPFGTTFRIGFRIKKKK